MGRLAHKRNHHARRDISRAARTRARKLDADQIQATLRNPDSLAKVMKPSELNLEKSGLGLFYCAHCDRHFPSDKDRAVHYRSKLHKRKAKKLEEDAYTQEEADRAAGLGVDNKQRGSTITADDNKS
ncbi:hypothetical protein K437DRAFT_46705 [Tilletiaria anomala UBC 951]|uniref:C2H2-type domain-containing protein n=1 Tax=Tilletiaria anomala (strain ATCC 24038 / CBS 436.72 / UBC 951) TaxID=1037660 RepID=A0A066WN26_TILAU|nr:uncharacterized protein K437DRAFT_46705 [Tilletiaria anomala UBC 951]KDN52035.1 hypothetical protein K437DRAFT_46705 [Tilletiaria anomala UBC 951]